MPLIPFGGARVLASNENVNGTSVADEGARIPDPMTRMALPGDLAAPAVTGAARVVDVTAKQSVIKVLPIRLLVERFIALLLVVDQAWIRYRTTHLCSGRMNAQLRWVAGAGRLATGVADVPPPCACAIPR